MKLSLFMGLAMMLLSPAISRIPEAKAKTPDEQAVLAADREQRRAVADADVEAIRKISHPSLRVNAPNNRILTRDDLVRMVASGEIRNEVFERTPEEVTISGNVAIVMGHEVVFPGVSSEQARMYGVRTLKRRYTNIYLRSSGRWLHIARHANIIPDAPAP